MMPIMEKLVQPPSSKSVRIEQEKVNIDTLICDLGKCLQICEYPINQQDENSKGIYENQGNFFEMIKLLASYNKEVSEVVLKNASQNARHNLPTIQKEIVHVFVRKVQNIIRETISYANFCLIVDEAHNESRRDKELFVIRYVNKNGYVKERFLDIVNVKDTITATLKQEICSVFLIMISTFKLFRVKDTIGLVICVESIMVFKL
ncbi:hypothetical protein L6164_013414 [Bauhinia variegata]|uniref:Uncharacterized protein n=1 Tax=Bauhinia variegata TaxID=167791 RepID=A0ACB9NJ06_BAUVA|nr:hypothetical protein L6164_013414 [Bauhinia variegata]